MPRNNRNREAVIWLTLAMVVVILLVARLGFLGLILGIGLAAIAFVGFRNSTVDPEIEALKASLRVARDDIAEIIDWYDDFTTGSDLEALTQRTLTYRALAVPNSDIPEIEDFQLRLDSSRRFLARVDTHLLQSDLSRHELEKLITIADQRASELACSWSDARRAARNAG